MNASIDQIQFTAYDPDQSFGHLPFAYLFTVPGDFPEGIPGYADLEMVVYRVRGQWEVWDIGHQETWGTGPSRRAALGYAFNKIAQVRRLHAADIANARVAVRESVPPYEIEVTGMSLVLAPQAIGVLVGIDHTEDGRATYVVDKVQGGGRCGIRADATVTRHSMDVGVLHIRCGCKAILAVRFERETEVLEYVREYLNSWKVCPKSIGAPAATDDQPEGDEGQAVAELPAR
ncbi:MULTISPECIES: hypothetical protein [unclassified Streptomyces]|uniref:hypothetical protein n=1 Tax=unclassified Streptomyces TaxID=2593676 RepID=UPI0020245829|nr:MULTISPECIES: hypothetical protein [unclassified Streptomyces]MCX4550582.1 hypothetical protein [Streptomyces sp. NBC_01500]WSC22029.1 hypothetical protein OIE60_21375 [Streptomyces sp. NBC_01766]